MNFRYVLVYYSSGNHLLVHYEADKAVSQL